MISFFPRMVYFFHFFTGSHNKYFPHWGSAIFFLIFIIVFWDKVEVDQECLFWSDIDAEKSEGEEVTSAAVTLAQLGPNLHKLWSYSCNLTKGRNVSCLAWNKLNPVS